MYNDEQRKHMQHLATIPPRDRCWSGWCERGPDGQWYCCSAPRTCPIDLTLADRLVLECEVCGGYPTVDSSHLQHSHRVGCTAAKRREFYEDLELGEAGA